MAEKYVTRFPDFRPSGKTLGGKRIAVGVDIDGCVDPGMYKHETGFALASIFHYKLQMITPIAVRAWMYENCYSLDRGITRFVSLYKWVDILAQTPAVGQAGVELPKFRYLKRWAEATKSLSPEALNEFLAGDDFSEILGPGDSKDEAIKELQDVSQWSKKVNELSIPASQNMMAFPNCVKVLRKLYEMGVDICAVSGTPEAHVISHLEQYGVLDVFSAIFAQQAGKKNLALTAMVAGYQEEIGNEPLLGTLEPRYDIIAMFGDAPKDYSEAKKANKNLTGKEDTPIRMYLVEIGKENDSWGYFYDQVLDKFISDSWSREEETALINRGLANLDRVWDPDTMPIDTFPKRG